MLETCVYDLRSLAESTVAQEKFKKPVASSEFDQIPKMGKITCIYVNTHVLKSRALVLVKYCHLTCPIL